jgi:predicted nucleotidyltransferase
VADLRKRFGAEILAAGVTGSVARGTAERYSDIDLLIILKRDRKDFPDCTIIDGTYSSIKHVTMKKALSELTETSAELPSIIGGYGRILAIHDPQGLLQKLERKASSIPSELFQRSARLALHQSFEDFCRAKNAFLDNDGVVLKDSVYIVTTSAVNIVACLNQAAFVSDREMFKAYKNFPKLPRNFVSIQELRYGNLNLRQLFSVLLQFYLDLVDFCLKEGVEFPVSATTLKELKP